MSFSRIIRNFFVILGIYTAVSGIKEIVVAMIKMIPSRYDDYR